MSNPIEEVQEKLIKMQTEMYHIGSKNTITAMISTFEKMPEMSKEELLVFLRDLIK